MNAWLSRMAVQSVPAAAALPLMFALGSPNVWCPGLENLGSRTFFFSIGKE